MDAYDEYFKRAYWGPSEGLHTWVAKRIISQLNSVNTVKEKNVLEIGTGTGRLAQQLKLFGASTYTGIEPNKQLADYCNQLGFNVLVQELPFLDSSFKDKFDQVVSLHVIEHAPSYLDARLWIEEMIRVTKPGGGHVNCVP